MIKILKRESFQYIRDNGRLISEIILAILFISLAIWFFRHERPEVYKIRNTLLDANIWWLLAGLVFVFVYILFQGLMYVSSFAAVGSRLRLGDAIILFLKRNFISVFLPAGGVSSLAFFNRDVEKTGINKTQIYFASSIYGFVGILSVVILAVPAFMIAVSTGPIDKGKWLALVIVMVILALILAVYFSVTRNGILYKWILKVFPTAEFFVNDLKNNNISRKQLLVTLGYSLVVDVVGIAHIYIAAIALGYTASLLTALIVYVVVVIFLIISPFLRGIGAIEMSMTYVLVQSGISEVQAIAITLLFRFFEFWLPLLAGIVSFILKVDKLLMRILPALLLFVLGIVNIISVLTPALPARLHVLREFLIPDVINISNTFVLITGLILLVTAAFMLKGLRTSWWFALVLSIGSFFGHFIKGIDFEEATIALLVIVILVVTRKEYYVKHNPKLSSVGLQTALLSVAAVMIFGTVGFYFLDKRHFHIDFSLFQSVRYTLQNYFLVGSGDLIPHDRLAHNFITLIKISGIGSLAFLVYSLVRPYVLRDIPSEEEIRRARFMVEKFGHSTLDYFKTYSDKLIFAPSHLNAFLSYRVSGNFAVALEDPVAETREDMKQCIIEFGRYCYENGVKDLYHRVPASSLPVYNELGKKSLFLGQEGVVNLSEFSLEGRDKKPIRNALNKVTERGFHARVYEPPLKDGLVQRLRAVSDEWLKTMEREELIFAQGMFLEEEIKYQTVITVENIEEKVVAFANIIPDYAENEGTYDLVRKTTDSPNGTMDFLIVELFKYFKSQGLGFVNVGFAPLSGLEVAQSFPERSMKFAYQKIRSFSQYRGQRDYKEKFNPVWSDKYLIYNQDYDLLQAPMVLSKIIRL